MKKTKKSTIYDLDGTVELKTALPLGIQHILAMFLGNISPILIISGMLQMSTSLKSALIQNAMFVAAIATIIQLYPFWRIGSKLPIVMGTSSGFIGTAKAMGVAYGYGSLMGAALIGGFIEVILGFFIKPLRKLFPPIVTSLVIISIGLSLLPVGISYFGGGSSASDFGSIEHLIVGSFVLVVILIARQFQGTINHASVLIGIVSGYILSICMGMVDFKQVVEADWFSLPQFMPVSFSFHIEVIAAMLIMFIATTVETIGNISGIANGGLDREASIEELQGGVIADGLGSAFAALFGVLPNTSFAQNAGLVTATKIVNRFTILTGALFLLLCGFCPKLSAIFSVMPQSVLGGAAVIMFSMIFVSGLRSLTREKIDERSALIIAVALGLGIGIGNVPHVLDQLPSWVGNIFGENSIILTFVIATFMNLILPKKKQV